ncbi:uncharacterized protein LOC141873450 [Acropora palmata]|uniref:uncharacterized protein LOC141873450 n=1 Tax=Acropora palmata TaxID=6131 RepID=UPI003DA16177
MKIISLASETFDSLANALGKDSTIGWKKLMLKGFSHIYSQDDVNEIEQKPSPAMILLNDLVAREESVENLIRALEKIGNLRAISIIKNGFCHHYRTFKTGQMRDGINHQDSVAWPPCINICQPVEHSMNDVPSNVEKAETFNLLSCPIQESGGNDRHPDEMECCQLLIQIIILLCFCQLNVQNNI